jgi:D-beta-D-heptose 7-phosphate kinase/D-beta-D-heptose 1-phosphate adenosyltransferase
MNRRVPAAAPALAPQRSLAQLLESFRGRRVLVIGEAMLDSYLEGTSGRLCREAPVPIVTLHSRTDAAGGAANTAVNVRSLGGEVEFLSATGDDEEGSTLRRILCERGVPLEHVLALRGRRTLAKQRVIASGQLLVRFDQGSTEPLDAEWEAALIDRLTALYSSCDAVIVSDYGYGVLTPRLIAALARLQRHTPRLLLADAKDLTAYRQVGLTAVKPNYEEAVHLLGAGRRETTEDRATQMAALSERLLELLGTQMAAITLDCDGALLCEREHPPYRTYARPTRNSRAAGAGDTFISALALALSAGADTPSAAELASAAARIVVAKDGTATCSAAELREYIAAENSFVTDPERLAARADFYRQQGQRIVFTNGCFDILHRGHITYLNRAKALGDILVVAVNTDESVARLKGPSRPINTLEDRVQVLCALSCVDHVVAFDEDTPSNLIRAIRPDVFVKGGDYTRETLPEAPLVEQLGGIVQLLPYLEDRSTTRLIERIRDAYGAVRGPQRSTHGRDRGLERGAKPALS